MEDFIEEFEINGEKFKYVKPTNIKELADAYETRDLIEKSNPGSILEGNSSSIREDMLKKQDSFIKNYLDSIPEFNNALLTKNISFFAKENGFSIGDLESSVGLSAGYISRTAKIDSKKKMSIDVVWKISKLFGVDVDDLIKHDFSIPERSIKIIIRFVKKLYRQTVEGQITWLNNGGYVDEIDLSYIKMGILQEDDVNTLYVFDEKNGFGRRTIVKDVYLLKNFIDNKDIALISYVFGDYQLAMYNKIEPHYDFLIVDANDDVCPCEKMFSTCDDAFSDLRIEVAKLVDFIEMCEFEPRISIKHRNIMEEYIKGK